VHQYLRSRSLKLLSKSSSSTCHMRFGRDDKGRAHLGD
jgi:hypothetical protein